MAIYSHRWNEHDYWRVVRSWSGMTYQEYVPIDSKEPERARKKAEAIDEAFSQRQRASYARKVFDLKYHLDDSGKIRGLSRQIQKRTDGRVNEVLRLRVNLPWEESPRYTTVSVTRYGLEEAFKIALNRYCDWYGFDTRSELRKALSQCVSAYMDAPIAPTLEVPSQAPQSDIRSGLEEEIAAFLSQRKKGPVIRGK